jgi:2-polyprenyl-6-methoxyphenol hydroxylase-like FAD-dependent oxidoreductase
LKKVGGSLTGLMSALVLKGLGHRVRVLERSEPAILQSEAAGIRAGPDVQTVIDRYVKGHESYAITARKVEIVDKEGNVVMRFPPQEDAHLTTWNTLYRMFKNSFVESEADEHVKYETGKTVDDVEYDGKNMIVKFHDKEGRWTEISADIVIAADGSNSTIRRKLLPRVTPEYAGYVTWRGTIPEDQVSKETRNALSNEIVLLRTEDGYIVS